MKKNIETFRGAVFIPLTHEEIGEQQPRQVAKAHLLEYLKEVGILTPEFKELPTWVRCVALTNQLGVTVVGVWNHPVKVRVPWTDETDNMRNALKAIAQMAKEAST